MKKLGMEKMEMMQGGAFYDGNVFCLGLWIGFLYASNIIDERVYFNAYSDYCIV